MTSANNSNFSFNEQSWIHKTWWSLGGGLSKGGTRRLGGHVIYERWTLIQKQSKKTCFFLTVGVHVFPYPKLRPRDWALYPRIMCAPKTRRGTSAWRDRITLWRSRTRLCSLRTKILFKGSCRLLQRTATVKLLSHARQQYNREIHWKTALCTVAGSTPSIFTRTNKLLAPHYC